jgi:hypothetical protein
MNRKPLDHINIRTAVCAALTVLAMGSAHAQNTGAPSYAGASLASTDYGTGLKVFLGGKITPIFGWEAQITSFGSEEYRPGYKHSATAIGASGTARFPLNASLSAFGKAGLHYVQPRLSGPGASDPRQLDRTGSGRWPDLEFLAHGCGALRAREHRRLGRQLRVRRLAVQLLTPPTPLRREG